MKVYTTKYALTRGIEIKDVEPGDGGDGTYVYSQGRYGQQFVMGKTAFHTCEEAVIAARKMRDKKVVSLLKQLAKVGGLIFPTKEPK